MAFIGSWSGISLCLRIVNYDASVMLTGKMSTVHPPLRSQWTTASFDFHQMAVHKRTTMLAHCNSKQNTWLCSKQSSFFPFFMHCPLVANRKTRWSIQDHRMFRYKIDHRSAWRLRLFYLNTFVKPNYVRMHQLAADLGLSFELLVFTDGQFFSVDDLCRVLEAVPLLQVVIEISLKEVRQHLKNAEEVIPLAVRE